MLIVKIVNLYINRKNREFITINHKVKIRVKSQKIVKNLSISIIKIVNLLILIVELKLELKVRKKLKIYRYQS